MLFNIHVIFCARLLISEKYDSPSHISSNGPRFSLIVLLKYMGSEPYIISSDDFRSTSNNGLVRMGTERQRGHSKVRPQLLPQNKAFRTFLKITNQSLTSIYSCLAQVGSHGGKMVRAKRAQNVPARDVKALAGQEGALEEDEGYQSQLVLKPSASKTASGLPRTHHYPVRALLETSGPDTLDPALQSQKEQRDRSFSAIFGDQPLEVAPEPTAPRTSKKHVRGNNWLKPTLLPSSESNFNGYHQSDGSPAVQAPHRSLTAVASPFVGRLDAFLAASTKEFLKVNPQGPVAVHEVDDSHQKRRPTLPPVWNIDGFPPGWCIPRKVAAPSSRKFDPESYAAAHPPSHSFLTQEELERISKLEPLIINGALHTLGETLHIEPSRRDNITGKPIGPRRFTRNMNQWRRPSASQNRTVAPRPSKANAGANGSARGKVVPGAPTGPKADRVLPSK